MVRIISLAAFCAFVSLLSGCGYEIRGIVSDTFVTFEELTRNPEKYLNKNVSFEYQGVPHIQSGYEAGKHDDSPCLQLSPDWIGRQAGSIDQYMKLADNGKIVGTVDAGCWEVFVNCVLPISMVGTISRETEDSLQLTNESVFTEKERGKDWKYPVFSKKKGIVLSGIFFEMEGGKSESARSLRFKEKTGQYFYFSRPKIYLTGARIPR